MHSYRVEYASWRPSHHDQAVGVGERKSIVVEADSLDEAKAKAPQALSALGPPPVINGVEYPRTVITCW